MALAKYSRPIEHAKFLLWVCGRVGDSDMLVGWMGGGIALDEDQKRGDGGGPSLSPDWGESC